MGNAISKLRKLPKSAEHIYIYIYTCAVSWVWHSTSRCIQGILGASLSWFILTIATQPAVPADVSALLVCMALHPQIVRRHCSKFSVALVLKWMQQKQDYSQSSVVSDSHRHICKLPGSYSSNEAESTYTMCLRIHLPVFVDKNQSQQTQVAPVVLVV